jgi:hypothetical protein
MKLWTKSALSRRGRWYTPRPRRLTASKRQRRGLRGANPSWGRTHWSGSTPLTLRSPKLSTAIIEESKREIGRTKTQVLRTIKTFDIAAYASCGDATAPRASIPIVRGSWPVAMPVTIAPAANKATTGSRENTDNGAVQERRLHKDHKQHFSVLPFETSTNKTVSDLVAFLIC